MSTVQAALAAANRMLGDAGIENAPRDTRRLMAASLQIPADRLLMLLAQDVVSRNPGADILFDVKCSRFENGFMLSSCANYYEILIYY